MNNDVSNIFGLVMEKLDEGHRAQLNWLWQQASNEIDGVRQDRDNFRQQAFEEFERVKQEHHAETQTYQMQIEQLQAENARLQQIQYQYVSQPHNQIKASQVTEQKFAALTADRDAANRRVKEVEAQCRNYLQQKNNLVIEVATIKRANQTLQNKHQSLTDKYSDLKEELGQEQRASSESNERIKKKDAEISDLKELVIKQASSSHGGHRTSSLPTSVTDNIVPSATTSLSNPRKRTRASTPDLNSNESRGITPAQKSFLLDTAKSVRDLVFSNFVQSQRLKTTVCDEDDAKDDSSGGNKDVIGFDSILSKLQKDQYAAFGDLEADFKEMIDHSVLSRLSVAEEKRALEMFYALETKISRLPAAN